MKKMIFKIIDMHCTSCAISIDGDLEDTGKVKSSKTSYAKAITEVEFDPVKISEKEIIDLIKQTGYTVKVE
ncbi:heavy-metal-associated domain-containing protein [Candidatus Gottesmanbacteria bacterium]|nr:heavy-metal-associated domain-containing protein [Candidatus Gottesmanbacteria bacterium]